MQDWETHEAELKKLKISDLKGMLCEFPAVTDVQKQAYRKLRVKGDIIAEILKLRKGEAGTKSISCFFGKQKDL